MPIDVFFAVKYRGMHDDSIMFEMNIHQASISSEH